MMKLRLLLTSLFGIVIMTAVTSPAPAAAFDLIPACQDNKNATACTENKPATNPIYGPDGIITKVANIIAVVVGIAAVIVIIIAGIQYMVSTGDPTKVNNAKNAIIYAIVGLVVAVIARTLVVYVVGKLG